MTTLSVTITLITHSLCWALFYSLWQGLFIYVALSLIFKAVPGLSAKAKYATSYISFLGLFIWFISTWVSQYEELKQAVSYSLSSPNNSIIDISGIANTTTSLSAASIWHAITNQLALHVPYIISLYLIGFVFMSGRFIINVLQVQRIINKDNVPAAVQRQEFVNIWQRTLGIHKEVSIYLSSRITVPTMIGAIKPIILLPASAISQLSTQQLEAILLHELAHIKRHDYLLNIFQTIGETILFFNPFVWLLSSIIRREREHCCDDLVVAYSNDPLPYAKALATLENSQQRSEQLSLSATGHKNQLLNRIKRIMEMKTNKINYSQFTIIMAVFVTLAFAVAMLSFTPTTFAQKTKQGNEDSTIVKSKKVYQYQTATTTTNDNGRITVVKKQISSDDNHDMDQAHDMDKDNDDAADDDTSSNKKVRTYISSSSTNNVDMKEIMKEVQKATKEATDAMANSGYKEEVEKAMKEATDELAKTDYEEEIEKATQEAQQQINSIDWDQIKANINMGLEEINKQLNDEKFRKSVNDDVKKSLEEGKKSLEDAMQKINEDHKEDSKNDK